MAVLWLLVITAESQYAVGKPLNFEGVVGGTGGRGCSCTSCRTQKRARYNDRLARKAYRKRAHEWRRAHVKNEEDAGQQSERGVAAMELRFDQILHREQNGAVNVVKQIERRQQRECGAGIELGGHGSSEYTRLWR